MRMSLAIMSHSQLTLLLLRIIQNSRKVHILII
nr:MAG TPA: hypothetical protein [Caudoviricetes sp.]